MCPQLGTWPKTQACALTGNRTGDPLVHRLTQSIEPHQPGIFKKLLLVCVWVCVYLLLLVFILHWIYSWAINFVSSVSSGISFSSSSGSDVHKVRTDWGWLQLQPCQPPNQRAFGCDAGQSAFVRGIHRSSFQQLGLHYTHTTLFLLLWSKIGALRSALPKAPICPF